MNTKSYRFTFDSNTIDLLMREDEIKALKDVIRNRGTYVFNAQNVTVVANFSSIGFFSAVPAIGAIG